MLRWVIATWLVVGCGRTTPPPPPIDPAWVDETLVCAVDALLEHAAASRGPEEVIAAALDVTKRPVDRVRVRRLVDQIVAAVEANRWTAIHRPSVIMLASLAVAELGDLPAAAALAERVLAVADPDRVYLTDSAIEILAWSGATDRARALAGDRPTALVSVAVGLARRGDNAAAQRVLADPSLAPSPTQDRSVTALIASAHARSGNLDAVRRIVDAIPGAEQRAYAWYWTAESLALTTHPDRAGFIDAAIAEIGEAARTDDGSELLVTWCELVRLRDRLGGGKAARLELHDWLLGGPPHTLRRELIGNNVVRAEAAGLPEEADRLLAAAPDVAKLRAGLDLALVRGQFARAFDQLDAHRRARAIARTQLVDPSSELSFSIDAIEPDLWLEFAAPPRDPALVERFRALVCTR